jgi:uncharacterized protein (DUF342 family)
MQAFIYPLGEETPDVGLDVIKGLIEMERIKVGIASNEKITEYLRSKPTKDNLFKLAQGKRAGQGEPTKIKYHFDTNPLKVATVDESGKIDYKNKGKIPMVNAEDLLAEIIPGTEGHSGKDIYGETIDPPAPDLVSLAIGMYVKRDEDGFKAFAEIYGRPELLDDGTICVSDTLPIPGDVGVETGHVEFDGNIEVRGSVQEGYKVKGKTLKADEIHNAEIEMEGDIVVSKGIIGGKILTDGSVKARHIRDATIDALGDIIVEREVYESHIETNGIFRIERGTIMGSSISAMKGLEASEIGSEASDPCTIITGIDNRLEKQIINFNMQIAQKEKEQEKLRSLVNEVKEKSHTLEAEIGKLAQQQDETISKGRPLKQTLKTLQETDDRKNIIKVLKIIKSLNAKLEHMQNDLDNLLNEQKQTEENIAKHDNEIKKLGDEIQELQDDIKSLLEMSKIRQPSSGVRATGKVYDRTAIRGRNASFIVKGTLQRVLIQEIENPEKNSDLGWIMSVSQI